MKKRRFDAALKLEEVQDILFSTNHTAMIAIKTARAFAEIEDDEKALSAMSAEARDLMLTLFTAYVSTSAYAIIFPRPAVSVERFEREFYKGEKPVNFSLTHLTAIIYRFDRLSGAAADPDDDTEFDIEGMVQTFRAFSEFMQIRSFGLLLPFSDKEMSKKVLDILSVENVPSEFSTKISRLAAAIYLDGMMNGAGRIDREILDAEKEAFDRMKDIIAYETICGDPDDLIQSALIGMMNMETAIYSSALNSTMSHTIRLSEENDRLKELAEIAG